jgi:hypothetical protein
VGHTESCHYPNQLAIAQFESTPGCRVNHGKREEEANMAMSVDEIGAMLVRDEALIADCNKFVQAVAGRVAIEFAIKKVDFGRAFLGKSDAIVSRFTHAPFISIAKDKDRATKLANEGQLVLGGLTLPDMLRYEPKKKPKPTMGHIVVIAPGGPSHYIAPHPGFPGARGGYPYCYQGAHISQYRFKSRTQVDIVFPRNSLPFIDYAYIDINEQR